MTERPILRVVGAAEPAEPEVDPEQVEMIAKGTERMVAAIKAGGNYWLLTNDGDEIGVTFCGGALESATMARIVAEDMMREALGL